MKLWWKIILALGLLLLAWAVTDAILSRVSNRNLNDTITTVRADYREVRDSNIRDQARIAELQGVVELADSANSELRTELDSSTGITADLREQNRLLSVALGKSREDTAILQTENQRLGDILGQSSGEAEAIGGVHFQLGESINRALEIITGLGD